jgi:hypothetical protein
MTYILSLSLSESLFPLPLLLPLPFFFYWIKFKNLRTWYNIIENRQNFMINRLCNL